MISYVFLNKNEDIKLLKQSIKSIYEQLNDGDEIIVIDDSTDKKQIEILKEFADEIIHPSEHVVMANKRLEGIWLSKNRIVACCDTDTIYPNYYGEVILTALKNFEAVHFKRKPLKPGILATLDSELSVIYPYEHCLAFRLKEFCRAYKLLGEIPDVAGLRKVDVGIYAFLMKKIYVNDVIVHTRLPSSGYKLIFKNIINI